LGEYCGVFEDGRLVAMAGERLQAGCLREISGVCTDPRYRGRGLARRLVTRLIVRQLARGQTPFLHVRCDNFAAQFYERLGFRRHSEPVVRVVTRLRE
jgi:ribosomal protein S18 acetylase RimI-like enzyme